MATVFSDLLAFFGISGTVPQNLGEFMPWFLSVLVALGLTLAVIRAVRYIGAYLTHPRF